MHACLHREGLGVGVEHRHGAEGNGGRVWAMPYGQATENWYTELTQEVTQNVEERPFAGSSFS